MVSVSPPEDPLDALSRLVREERVELARVARREGLDPETALDCVHDALCTFLGLAQRGALPADPTAYAPFLGEIVRNAARNKRRRHHLSRRHETLDAIEPGAEEATTEALLAEAEAHVRLRFCVERLCDTQRSVVTLRLLDEQRGEDVATALGISRAYVDVLLHRAKGSLRACMMHE